MQQRRKFIQNIGLSSLGLGLAGLGASPLLAQKNQKFRLAMPKFSQHKKAAQFVATDFGINIELIEYDNDEVFGNMLKTGKASCDALVVLGSQFDQIIANKLVAPINRAFMPNIQNLKANYTSPIDSLNHYSVAPLKTYYGIICDTNRFKLTSWNAIFNKIPQTNNKKLRIGWYNNGLLMMRIAMMYLGLDANSKEQKDYQKAENFLKNIYESNDITLCNYDSEIKILTEELDLAMGSVGRSMAVKQVNPALNFIHVAEGTLSEEICLMIMQNSPAILEAHAFYDFALNPVVMTKVIEITRMPHNFDINDKQISLNYLKNPAINPSPKTNIINVKPIGYENSQELNFRFKRALGIKDL